MKLTQDEFIREFNEYFGYEPKAYFCDLSPLEVFGFINHLISKQPSGDIEKIKKIKPDYNHSESYQHGFHDAIQVVLDIMNSPKSKQKPSEVDRNWIEDFRHENGNYFNTCTICENEFKGHKRRVVCKVCSSLPQPLSEEEIISKITDGLLSSKLFRLPTKDCFNLAEEIVHNHFKSLSLPPDSKENEENSIKDAIKNNCSFDNNSEI